MGLHKVITGRGEVDYYTHTVQCTCGNRINIPITPEIEARAKEDYNIAEESAQRELDRLWLWLYGVSWVGLLRFWLKKKKANGEV